MSDHTFSVNMHSRNKAKKDFNANTHVKRAPLCAPRLKLHLPPIVMEENNSTTCLDFDSVQFGCKLVIDCKHVPVLNLFAFWLLGKHSLRGLSTCQRLQCSYQLSLWDIRLLLDLLPYSSIALKSN